MTDTQTNTILAVTGDDERYAPVRRAALDRARRDRAALVLYDIDAAASVFESPLPTAWSADEDEEYSGERLGPVQLEALGRGPVANQVRDAQRSGVPAWGWLPDSTGGDALASYARSQGVSRIYVGADEAELTKEIDLPVEVVPGLPKR